MSYFGLEGKMKNRFFIKDERTTAVYNRIGAFGFHILSLLLWIDLIYRMVVLNQRGKELLDIIIILIFVGVIYKLMTTYFIREVIINERKKKLSILSFISLVLGLFSILIFWVSGVLSIPGPLDIISYWLSIALGIAAIVFGAIDLHRIKTGKSNVKGKGFNIAGIILGAVGISLFVLLFFYLTFWS